MGNDGFLMVLGSLMQAYMSCGILCVCICVYRDIKNELGFVCDLGDF